MSEAWSQWEGRVVNGEFQLKKYLGGSDQSAVFLTENPGREPQPAAIKLIAAEPANAELQLSQWGLAQRLSHPHLIRILRTGRCRLGTGELIFAVMEYGEENLAQILPGRPLTSQEAREMLGPTLDALAYLHGQGLVHSHLKPANVFAINDQLKLASDSICRTNEDEPVSGPVKPSVYDPPEVARGKRSPAADVWSLGMTLAEVLTQGLPFWRDSDKDQAEPIVPDLPAPFAEIVRGCLRRDPQRRLTIAGIAARLHAGAPPQPGRPVKAETPQQPARAATAKPLPPKPPAISYLEATIRRFTFPAVVVVAAALVALLAGLGLFRRHQEPQPDVIAVKPAPKPDAQGPHAGKPSPKTLSPKTSSPKTGSPETKTGQQPGSAGNLPQPTPAPQVKPQPVRLISDLPALARNGGASGASSNSGPNGGPGGGVNSIPTSASGDTGDSGVGVVQRFVPNPPQSANDTIQGTIRISVKVKVDASGNVTAAGLDVPGPSKYFARLSLEAAQRWKFTPSGPAGRQFVLHFEFRNTGPRAFATRAGR